ncbi:MAG: DUF4397 domain-containing protein [Gammaproteobacteria bacterium]|nr:DUF4397 domain-containing protein [Gammaproteobacteria bacterium]NNC56802.1 DUF4397 domain-containing protein [Woeseiaceae bacterium]NNL49173.1 DUF4397 domain-containing protein [Woeseiaceae bacterium]
MKRTSILLACATALLLGACGSDSSLPVPTGKASIRAINAMPSSNQFSFLIEERSIGTAAYAAATSIARYDDLEYTFNIDVLFAGESSSRRIASQFIDFEANKEYTLLVSGPLSGPTLTLWTRDERAFDEADTVFEATFAHASASLGPLDYYFADPSVTPALGNQVATLSFGEISSTTDYSGGDFVLTITEAGNPNAVVHVSDTTTFPARGAFLLLPFDSGIDNTAPIIVRALNSLGNSASLPDLRFAPTIEFVNASMDLGISDIYDDEALTSLRVADHAYGDVSAELDIAAATNTFYYTPAGDTTAVTLEGTLSAFGGTRYRLVAAGSAGDITANLFIPDRRPVDSHAKLVPLQTSNNFDFLDLYAVEADTGIEDALPARVGLGSGEAASTIALAAGSYDLYVTEFNDKVVLAGPYRIDVSVRDVIDMIVIDTVDPAVLDALFLSGGPTT